MNGACASAEVRERRVLGLGRVVDERRVPLAERAAPGVLARDSHRRAVLEQQ